MLSKTYWAAVRGRNPEESHYLLGLEAVGRVGIPSKGLVAGQSLPSNWYVVYANENEHPFFDRSKLLASSSRTDLVLMEIDDETLSCVLERFHEGKSLWRVQYASAAGPSSLIAEGELPSEFETIKGQYKELQDSQKVESGLEVDYFFEIPLEFARSVVGFRHDDNTGNGDLLRDTSKPKGILGLFGRR